MACENLQKAYGNVYSVYLLITWSNKIPFKER